MLCEFEGGAKWEYDIADDQWIESVRDINSLQKNFDMNENKITLEMQAEKIKNNPISAVKSSWWF